MNDVDLQEDLPGGGTLTTTIPAQRHAAVRSMLLAEARQRTAAPSAVATTTRRTSSRAHRSATPSWARWTGLVAAPALLAAAAAAVWAAGAEVTPPSAVVPAPQELMAWSPVPSLVEVPGAGTVQGGSAGPGEASDWTTACGQWMGGSFFSFQGAAEMSARATHHVLAEERAGSVLCVDLALGDGSAAHQTVAVGGLDPASGPAQSFMAGSSTLVTPPAGDDVLLLGGDDTAGPHRGDASTALLYGAAGPGVTGMQVVLANGVRITASLRDGVWAAWWPLDRGEARGAQLVVSSAQGERPVGPETVRMAVDPV